MDYGPPESIAEAGPPVGLNVRFSCRHSGTAFGEGRLIQVAVGLARATGALLTNRAGYSANAQSSATCLAEPSFQLGRRLDRNTKLSTQRQPFGPTDNVCGQAPVDNEVVAIDETRAIAR